MIVKILEIATSGFWAFIGVFILVGGFTVTVVGGIVRTLTRAIRRPIIMKHGWPPVHCDADGDFKEKEED